MDEKNVPLVKAVVHLADKKLVKGYLKDATGAWSEPGATAYTPLPEEFELRLLDGSSATISLGDAKAVFFVHEFQGPGHDELKFFRNGPEFPGLWVRLRFSDDEIAEGLVQNALSLLVDPGFFLRPLDPQSNNRMVYALKKHLIDFQIMGVKPEY